MAGRLLKQCLLGLLVGLAASVAVPDRVEAGRDAHAGLECRTCHLDGDATTAETGHRLAASQLALCGRCHQGAVEASHPSGFTPARALPADFPLDWKGQMTCSTCHDLHGPAEGRRGGVRMAPGAPNQCASCHGRKILTDQALSNRPLLAPGHIAVQADKGRSGLDPYSARCVDCHEDELSLPGEPRIMAFTATNGTGMTNHPIGSTYRQADLARDLRPPATLPAQVLLPDGRVSCLSCHRGYSFEHGALIESERGLCRQCHDK